MSRRKSPATIVFAVILGLATPSGLEASRVASSKFKDCSTLLKKYTKGVAVSKAKRGKTKATINASVYRANKALDRDQNGIACDSGDLAVAWTAYEFSGTGPDVKALTSPANEPALVTFTHSGESNFAVWSLDSKLEQIDLLANEIGDYTGTIFLDRGYSFTPEVARHLQIENAESWTAKVAPASSAATFLGKSAGSGDAVLRYDGGRTTISVVHSGEGNFALTAYTKEGFYDDLLANEIGDFSGRVVLPENCYIVISADGKWSIAK